MRLVDEVAIQVLLAARRKLPRMFKRDRHLEEFAEVPGLREGSRTYYVDNVEYRLEEFVRRRLMDEHIPHRFDQASVTWALAVLQKEPELATSDEVISADNDGQTLAGLLASYLADKVWDRVSDDIKSYAVELGFDFDYELSQDDYEAQVLSSHNP